MPSDSETIASLKLRLAYDRETGVFTWLNGPRSGKTAGTLHQNGYIQIKVGGRLYFAHRLAIAFTLERFPADQVDHINGARTDNRRANLREATSAENHQNLKVKSNNKSGYPGVSFCVRDSKWVAHIRVGRKGKHLGSFNSPEEAHAEYLKAKRELHPFQPFLRS